jgi:hypothetical protein
MDADGHDDDRRVATTDDHASTPGVDHANPPGVDHASTPETPVFDAHTRTSGGVACPA